nr:non-specific lipid-transfer protein 2 [Ipomoea batatas]
MIVAVVVVVLAEAQFSWAACDVNQLSPCLSAFTSNAPPSNLCCQRLKQQKPCFCQYLKDPTLKQYLSAGKKVATACKKHDKKAHQGIKDAGRIGSNPFCN